MEPKPVLPTHMTEQRTEYWTKVKGPDGNVYAQRRVCVAANMPLTGVTSDMLPLSTIGTRTVKVFVRSGAPPSSPLAKETEVPPQPPTDDEADEEWLKSVIEGVYKKWARVSVRQCTLNNGNEVRVVFLQHSDDLDDDAYVTADVWHLMTPADRARWVNERDGLRFWETCDTVSCLVKDVESEIEKRSVINNY